VGICWTPPVRPATMPAAASLPPAQLARGSFVTYSWAEALSLPKCNGAGAYPRPLPSPSRTRYARLPRLQSGAADTNPNIQEAKW
jgi:hypothetical protein